MKITRRLAIAAAGTVASAAMAFGAIATLPQHQDQVVADSTWGFVGHTDGDSTWRVATASGEPVAPIEITPMDSTW